MPETDDTPQPKAPADTSWVRMSDGDDEAARKAKAAAGRALLGGIAGFFRDLFAGPPATPTYLVPPSLAPLVPLGDRPQRPSDPVDSRPTWVRWMEFGGWTRWREAKSVETDGHWLLITWPQEGQMTLLPEHEVRGEVQVRRTDPDADQS